MLHLPRRAAPPPPGAGLTKLADPRRVLLGWLVFLALAGVVGAAAWPYGLGREARRLHREFVAAGYLRAATGHAQAVPVRRAQALAALKRAVALDPDNPTIAQGAAQLYVELRAYREAAEWLRRRAEAAKPPAPGGTAEAEALLLRISLAQSLVMTGRASEGDRMLGQIETEVYAARQRNLMPDPLFALMLNNLGYVRSLGKLGLPEALRMVSTAVQLQPRQPAYVDSLGWVEYQLGRHRDAAFHLEQAVRLHLPAESAEMYYHLGAAYARLGKKSDARWALQRSLELDPSFVEATNELRLLGQELPRPALAARFAIPA